MHEYLTEGVGLFIYVFTMNYLVDTVTKALTPMCAGWKSVYLFLFLFIFIYYKIVHNSTVWGYSLIASWAGSLNARTAV